MGGADDDNVPAGQLERKGVIGLLVLEFLPDHVNKGDLHFRGHFPRQVAGGLVGDKDDIVTGGGFHGYIQVSGCRCQGSASIPKRILSRLQPVKGFARPGGIGAWERYLVDLGSLVAIISAARYSGNFFIQREGSARKR